jgi:hypothetical protein
VSFAPEGIFIKAEFVSLGIIAHECFHFEEAMRCPGGPDVWLAYYLLEIAARLWVSSLILFELDFDEALDEAYWYSSAEVRAEDWQ